MNDPLTIVQTAYAAFGRGDVPAMLGMMSDSFALKFHGDRAAPYTASIVGKGQMAEWFGAVAQADHFEVFEPREFFAGPEHVTVLGWERTVTQPGGGSFECEWVHVWTVKAGLITRLWGMLDSEAAGRARASR